MQVFVLRHGQAEAQVTTDEARNLTEKGRADVAANVKASLDELRDVQEIWVSHLVRAQQTAQIVQRMFASQAIHASLKTTQLIAPEGHPDAVFDLLQASALTSVLLVSHQPFVGDFIDIFCGSPRGAHPMNTSSMAFIRCDVAAKSCGELRWLKHVSG